MPFERELRRENGIWEVYAEGRWHSVQANFANLHQALQEYTGVASADTQGNQTLIHSDPNKNISVMALADDVRNNTQRYAYDPRGREENEMLRQQVVAAQGAQLPGPQAGSMGQYIESVGRQARQDQRSVPEILGQQGQQGQQDPQDESRWNVERTAEAQEHMPYWYPGAVQSYIGVSWPEVVRQAEIGRRDRPGEPTIFDEALKYAKSIGATDLPDEVKEPRGPTSLKAYFDQQEATAAAAGDFEEVQRLQQKYADLTATDQTEAPRAAPRITLDQAIDDAILSGDTARASELIAARDRAQAGSGMTRSQAIQYAAQFAQTSDEFDRMLAAITQQYAPQQPVGPSPEQLRQQRLADIRQYIQPAPFPGGPPGTGIPMPPLTSAGQAYAQYTAKIPSPDDSFYVGATGTPTPERVRQQDPFTGEPIVSTPEQVTGDPSLDFYAGRQPFDPASQEAFETAGIEKTPFSPGGVPLIPVPAGTEFAEGTAGFKSVYDLSGRPKSQDQLTIDAELAELADLESRHTATSMYVPGETQYATKVIRDPYGRVISTEVGEGDPERSEIIPPLPGYNRRNLTEYGKRALGAEGITMDPVPVIAPGRTVTSLYDDKENPELEKRHNELLQRRRERNNPNLIPRAQQQTGAPRFGSANAFEQTIGNIKQGRTQRKLSSQKAGRTFKFGLS